MAGRVGTLAQFAVAATSSVIVVVIALSGLYFGRFWFSDAIAGAALASAWGAVVVAIAVWRSPAPSPSRSLMPVIILAVLCLSVALQLGGDRSSDQSNWPRGNPMVLGTKEQWVDSSWKKLPCFRSDMGGDQMEPLEVQWSSNIEDMTGRLRAWGWVKGVDLSARSLLFLAAPNVSATALPVLPKLNNGVPSSLVLTRAGKTRDERDVLRFLAKRLRDNRRK